MAGLSPEPSRSDCRDGLLRGANRHVWCALQLLRHAHDRRRILHFNVTKHPTSLWVVQQLREAFPFGTVPRFLILDRDGKYGIEVPAAVRSLKIKPLRTSIESPWQNGVAERWVESCRRDLLDHIIAVNDRHLKRLLSEYVRYYHDDRTHLGLGKGTPGGRTRFVTRGRVLSHERVGGLHHRYDRAAISASNFSPSLQYDVPRVRASLRLRDRSRSSKRFLTEFRLAFQSEAQGESRHFRRG